MRANNKHTSKKTLCQNYLETEKSLNDEKKFLLCTNCYAIYFYKSWHHITPKNLCWLQNKNLINYTRCPACTQIHNHQYEGELKITNIPKKFTLNLIQLINNYAKQAYEQDCQHRLIGIFQNYGNSITIQVTENQLAQRLAKKIREAFDLVDIEVIFSNTPYDTERVRLEFKSIYS